MRNPFSRPGLAALIVLSSLVPVAGCGIFGDEDSAEGIWQTQGADRVFMHVTTNRITTYDFAGDAFEGGDACYRITVSNVVTVEDDEYTVSSSTQPSLRIRLTLEVVDDRLTVTSGGISESFVRSDREISSFVPECPAR